MSSGWAVLPEGKGMRMSRKILRENNVLALSDLKQRLCDDMDRFQRIFQNVTEFLFEHDLEGRFLGISPRFVGFLGYSRDELLSMNVKDLLLEKHQSTFNSYLCRVRESGEDEGLIQIITKAGRKRIAEHKTQLHTYADGTTTILGIARDVTDVLETDQALIESEIRFRSILDSIEDGYYEVDLEGNFTFFNDQIPKHIGYSSDELIGVNYRKIMDKENAKKVYQTFHKVFTTSVSVTNVDWEQTGKDGSRIFVESSVSLRRDMKGNPIGFCGIIRDITERKRSENKLAYMAYHDPLTGLYNRKAFMERLEKAIREARQYENSRSILYIDLDRFKKVNDVYGHEIGDKLLIQVAARLNDTLRENDYVSRLGGDEFTVILSGSGRSTSEKVAVRVLKVLSQPYQIQGITIDFVTPSIGVSTFPDDGHDADTLLKSADKAMYSAKGKGKCCIRFCKDIEPLEPRSRKGR
jgi:diguanylate cyclase (GGDEF)-like protein/PAS domain S-box-containing protein